MDRLTVSQDDLTGPMARPWRVHNGLAVLHLRVDVYGAPDEPRRRAGDTVLARWWDGQPPYARGWMLHDIGVVCILNELDVEVIERP